MLKKGVKIGLWVAGVAVFVILLTVAGLFDLQISQGLYNENSFFGWFFAYLGDGIGYFMMLIAMVILINCTDRRGPRPYLWWIAAAGVFAAVFVNSYWFSDAFFKEEIAHAWVYAGAIALFFTPIIIWLTDKIDKDLMKKLALFALFIILVVGISQIITQGLKLVWCRLRFRNMADGAGFTPWWYPNGTKAGREHLIAAGSYLPEDAFKSFPSGHTASAATLFSLIILPYIFKDKMPKWGVVMCYVVPWMVTAVIALSRIINGAHFLSDVTFGALSAIFAAIVSKIAIAEFFKRKNKSQIVEG